MCHRISGNTTIVNTFYRKHRLLRYDNASKRMILTLYANGDMEVQRERHRRRHQAHSLHALAEIRAIYEGLPTPFLFSYMLAALCVILLILQPHLSPEASPCKYGYSAILTAIMSYIADKKRLQVGHVFTLQTSRGIYIKMMKLQKRTTYYINYFHHCIWDAEKPWFREEFQSIPSTKADDLYSRHRYLRESIFGNIGTL